MRTINRCDMPLVLWWLLMAIVVTLALVACNAEGTVQEVPHTIIDNKIIAEDTDIKIITDYIKQGSGWIYPEITYKNLPGDAANIDLTFGVNTDEMRFTKAEYWNPHYEEWETQQQQDLFNVEIIGIYDGTELDYGNSYNTHKRIIIHDVSNGTHTDKITSNVSFDTYQQWDGHYTIFWHTEESGIVDWSSIPNDKITIHDFDYNEKNVWYILNEVYVQENGINKMRIYVELKHGIGDRSYKYDIATKLSSDTLQEAVINNRFKFIDPYGDATNFNSTWNTSKISIGSTNNTSIKLPLEVAGTYDFTVWWGDGNSDNITAWNQANTTHNYSSQGEYNVVIDGTITGFQFNNGGDRLKIINITNWGNLNLGNSNGYFHGCSNLNVGATDTLDLTGTISFYYAFKDCYDLTTLNTSNWDTSSVTTFRHAFRSCYDLTSLDVSNWDTSSVTTFYYTFYKCFDLTSLNVSNWDTSSVTTFNTAFQDCYSLTSLDVSNWNVSSVTSFDTAFYGVTLNTSNYDDMLITFASQSLQNNVPFHAGNSKYSLFGEYSRNYTTVGIHNWTITDGGLEAENPVTSLHYNSTTNYFNRIESDGILSVNRSVITTDATNWTANSTEANNTYWIFTTPVTPAGYTNFTLSGVDLDNFTVSSMIPNTNYTVNNTSIIGYFVTDGIGNATFETDLIADDYNIALTTSANLDNFTFTNSAITPHTTREGEPFTVTADINDSDGTISTAIVKISSTNYTMTNTGGDTWVYTFTSTSIPTTYYIQNFFAQDNDGAWNSTSSTLSIDVVSSTGTGDSGGISPTPTPTPTPTPKPITEEIEEELTGAITNISNAIEVLIFPYKTTILRVNLKTDDRLYIKEMLIPNMTECTYTPEIIHRCVVKDEVIRLTVNFDPDTAGLFYIDDDHIKVYDGTNYYHTEFDMYVLNLMVSINVPENNLNNPSKLLFSSNESSTISGVRIWWPLVLLVIFAIYSKKKK